MHTKQFTRLVRKQKLLYQHIYHSHAPLCHFHLKLKYTNIHGTYSVFRRIAYELRHLTQSHPNVEHMNIFHGFGSNGKKLFAMMLYWCNAILNILDSFR